VAQLEDVPSTAPAGFWDEWAREGDFGGRWHSIGEQLGIRGFGVNANVADAGRELIVPHTETEYGEQEELYLVMRGRARFTCDGETIELAAGGLLLVEHAVQRDAVALEDGTLVLCVGGTPDRPYSPS
jgi:mannose-6-phosphate isomerase-like protein (cupin superfamily)